MKLPIAVLCFALISDISATSDSGVITYEACEDPSGTFLPVEGSCTEYTLCANGVLIPSKCGEGKYFDELYGYCRKDTDYECIPPPTTEEPTTLSPYECPTDSTGTLVPIEGSCYQYQLCTSSGPVPLRCSEGLRFDNSLQRCTSDTEGFCWGSSTTTEDTSTTDSTTAEITTPTVTTSTEVTSTSATSETTTTESSTTTVTTSSGPSSTASTTSEPTTQETSTTTEASTETTTTITTPETTTSIQSTTTARTTTATPEPTTTTLQPSSTTEETSTSPDASTSTTELAITTTPEPSTDSTETTESPATITTTLEPSTTTQTSSETSSTTEAINVCEGVTIGTVPHKDCDKFYLCQNGSPTVQVCSEGDYFDKTTSQCTQDTNGVCLGRCYNTRTGTLFADESNCQYYYECQAGDEILKSCEEGYYFDGVKSACEADVDNTCGSVSPTICQNQVDGTIISHTECGSYYECSNNEAVVKSCANGYRFDVEQFTCVEDPTFACFCELNSESVFGAGENCNKYYECNSGAASIESCPQGEYFDETELRCVAGNSVDCFSAATTTLAA